MRPSKLNIIDLFAGCGGLSSGFQSVKENPYNIVLADEWDPTTAHCYKLNHPKIEVLVEDIKKVSAHRILKQTNLKKNELDLVIGGPPCQGFSNAGAHLLDDPRNQYFKEFARIVQETNPNVVVMENVPQFVTLEKGFFYNQLVKLLTKFGYTTKAKVLLASDFGVPQIRQRSFVISVKKDFFDEEITFPKPTHEKIEYTLELEKGNVIEYNNRKQNDELKKFVSVEEAIGDLPLLNPKNPVATDYKQKAFSEYQKQLRTKSKRISNHELWGHSADLLEYISKIPEGGRMIDFYPEKQWKGKGFSQAYARLHRSGIAHTITTFIHNPGSGRFIHYRDTRAISIREAARLQSFNDDFVFYGSKTQQEKQVGNAVPPLLAQKIGEHVYQLVFKKSAPIGIASNLKIPIVA